MRTNHVPGIPLRVFPGLTREPYHGVPEYIAANSVLAIFTGLAPTEAELWNITNISEYIENNRENLVHTETLSLKFNYYGLEQKRTIQKWPIGVTKFNALKAPTTFNKFTGSPYYKNQYKIVNDLLDPSQPLYLETFDENTNLLNNISIECTGTTHEVLSDEVNANNQKFTKKNSLWALIKVLDKDSTLNVTDNDLIFFVPSVGTDPKDSIYISSSNFEPEEEIELRNITISLFQTYKITDTVISTEPLNPNNPNQIAVDLVTKKSIYFNSVWGNRISESYRDTIISKTSFYGTLNISGHGTHNTTLTTRNYDNAFFTAYNGFYLSDIRNSTGSTAAYLNSPITRNELVLNLYKNEAWTNDYKQSIHWLFHTKIIYGFIINESMLNIIDEINNMTLNNLLPTNENMIQRGWLSREKRIPDHQNNNTYNDFYLTWTNNNFAAMLLKVLVQQSYFSEDIRNTCKKILLDLGFNEFLIDKALVSTYPISINPNEFTSEFSKESRTMIIKKDTPSNIFKRFNMEVSNPYHEKLYILFPRMLNTKDMYSDSTTFLGGGHASYGYAGVPLGQFSPGSCVSFITDTKKILDGEVVDKTTHRTSIYDYTAISIGVKDSNSDLEFDQMDIIDSIDAIYAKMRIPNKF